MAVPNDVRVVEMATSMGIDQRELSKLSAQAQSLTKADLINLGEWAQVDQCTPTGEGTKYASLTLADVSTIKAVFGKAVATSSVKQSNGWTIACCCCPCCCASAVLKSVDANGKVVSALTFSLS